PNSYRYTALRPLPRSCDPFTPKRELMFLTSVESPPTASSASTNDTAVLMRPNHVASACATAGTTSVPATATAISFLFIGTRLLNVSECSTARNHQSHCQLFTCSDEKATPKWRI